MNDHALVGYICILFTFIERKINITTIINIHIMHKIFSVGKKPNSREKPILLKFH